MRRIEENWYSRATDKSDLGAITFQHDAAAETITSNGWLWSESSLRKHSQLLCGTYPAVLPLAERKVLQCHQLRSLLQMQQQNIQKTALPASLLDVADQQALLQQY